MEGVRGGESVNSSQASQAPYKVATRGRIFMGRGRLGWGVG